MADPVDDCSLVRQYSKSGQIVQNDVLLQFSIPGLPFGGVGQSVECRVVSPRRMEHGHSHHAAQTPN